MLQNALFTSIDVSPLRGAHVFELKDGGGEVEELLGRGARSICWREERFVREPRARAVGRAAAIGARQPARGRRLGGPGFRLPVGKKPRRRRKEAPCL
ncbi:MAG: hypothetical protein ACLSVD_00925 [Eggerthellaceae bacterium]